MFWEFKLPSALRGPTTEAAWGMVAFKNKLHT